MSTKGGGSSCSRHSNTVLEGDNAWRVGVPSVRRQPMSGSCVDLPYTSEGRQRQLWVIAAIRRRILCGSTQPSAATLGQSSSGFRSPCTPPARQPGLSRPAAGRLVGAEARSRNVGTRSVLRYLTRRSCLTGVAVRPRREFSVATFWRAPQGSPAKGRAANVKPGRRSTQTPPRAPPTNRFKPSQEPLQQLPRMLVQRHTVLHDEAHTMPTRDQQTAFTQPANVVFRLEHEISTTPVRTDSPGAGR